MEATVSILEKYEQEEDIIDSMMSILRFESGIDAQPANLRNRCLDTIQVINQVVSIQSAPNESFSRDQADTFTDSRGWIPNAFFERNEAAWRGRVKREAASSVYDNVSTASDALIHAIAEDFWGVSLVSSGDGHASNLGGTKSPIVQDIFNNIIAIKENPSDERKDYYYHPRDRNGKILRNRFTTKKVELALSSYIEACEEATLAVTAVLTKLSNTLCETGHLPSITQAAHTNLIVSTASNHAAQSNQAGWNIGKNPAHPNIEMSTNEETLNGNIAGHFTSLWPYWMDKSEAVLNSFELNGLFLLTAPNMSGKSTIMRSTAAAALLTNCGFSAPHHSLEGSILSSLEVHPLMYQLRISLLLAPKWKIFLLY